MAEEGYTFVSDRALLYDVEPWNRLGFGVPNFGDNIGTKSLPIWNLADYIGKAQLYIMSHIDAQRMQPPSRNTVERMGKLLNRINSVLGSRTTPYNQARLEEGHSTAQLRVWNVHPVPFFRSAIVRNHWLSEYNELTMIGLTNMYQHSDNALSLTVTDAFAKSVWSYFKRVKLLLGSELLLIPPATLEPDTFIFTDANYQTYNPELVTLNFEALDTPGAIQSTATEDDLRPLFEGIPANVIAPKLKQYPAVGELGWSGSPLPEDASASGTEGSAAAVAEAGRNIGEPQV